MTKQPQTPWWIKVFVPFHLFCITAWALPNRDELVLAGLSGQGTDALLVANQRNVKTNPILRYYLMSTSLWQYWDMFAPNPSQRDFYGSARVIYRDGTERPFAYPRIYTASIPMKMPLERYRKFYENAHLEKNPFIWKPFAQRIALNSFQDPNNPPVRVILRRNWRDVAPPGKPQVQEYNWFDYFTYVVDQDDLKRRKSSG